MADASLESVLDGLGIRRGGVLMVHASLRGTGTHPRRVLAALRKVLGPGGTLVVPAFTPENSTTSRAHRRLVAGLSKQETHRLRARMPPFDPDLTPCPEMGAFAEWVRNAPGAVRSTHPQTSLAGLGPRAAGLLADHDPRCHLGERSPLARLYDADAQILLLRVGFEVCSAFHLAEYRLDPPPPRREYRCVVGEPGNWITYEDLALDDGDFAAIGARLPDGLRTVREWAGRSVVVLGMRGAVDGARAQMTSARRGLA
jgi:aminoglycoside 3-N-acetyltransferase